MHKLNTSQAKGDQSKAACNDPQARGDQPLATRGDQSLASSGDQSQAKGGDQSHAKGGDQSQANKTRANSVSFNGIELSYFQCPSGKICQSK